MGYILGIASQKGGVGKSTLARLIAREAAQAGLNVKIADLDTAQTTSVKWAARRAERGYEPSIRAEVLPSVKTGLSEAANFDLYIFDGAPHSSKQTLEVARASDMVVIPTSEGIDDLEPAVVLANDLGAGGINADAIAFALCLVGDSARELEGARRYLSKTPYSVLDGEIPFRTGFKIALDQGKAITETSFPKLRLCADAMAQSIIDAIESASERQVA